MRKILFRGYNKTHGWIEGYYFQNRGRSFVCPDEWANGKSWSDYEVDPASVGEFADAVSDNGEKIFEGDIVEYEGEVYYVVFYEGRFAMATLEQYELIKKGIHPFMGDYTTFNKTIGDFEYQGLISINGQVYEKDTV